MTLPPNGVWVMTRTFLPSMATKLALSERGCHRYRHPLEKTHAPPVWRRSICTCFAAGGPAKQLSLGWQHLTSRSFTCRVTVLVTVLVTVCLKFTAFPTLPNRHVTATRGLSVQQLTRVTTGGGSCRFTDRNDQSGV